MSITLNGKQIKDLAEFAGFVVDDPVETDLLETDYTIGVCPSEGISNDDDNKMRHYGHIAVLSEYPEEGCYPLGDEL